VREANHSVGRNTALNQVALHQLSQAGITPQLATAGDDARSPSATVELRSARGAVGGVVVVTEQEDGVGELWRLVHHPELASSAQQRVPQQVHDAQNGQEHEQHQKIEDDSAVLPRGHAVGSV
jgi:hypothetical protein